MPTRVVIQGAKPGRGHVMVQVFDPREPLRSSNSPIIIPESEEHEFYVESGVKALMVTEHTGDVPQAVSTVQVPQVAAPAEGIAKSSSKTK